METFKKRAHNLYSIEREEEFMQQTASNVLPLLLDADKQRLVMTKLADTKGLQRWMIFRNKSAPDVLPDFTALKNVLDSGNMRCLKWMISFKQQVEDALMDKRGQSLSEVIRYGYLPIIKQLINIPRVLELCKNDWTQAIVSDMLKYCENMKVVDYVLDVLSDSKADHLVRILRGRVNLWANMECCNNNSVSILKSIVNKIGETEFVEITFPDNAKNVLEYAIIEGKMHDIKYLLSIKAIGARYDCKDDSDEINEAMYRIVQFTLTRWKDDTVLDDVFEAFGLTKKTIGRYLQYTKQMIMTFEFEGVKYDDIVARTIRWRSLNRVKQIMDIIGETCFIDHVLARDGENLNGLDHCIQATTDPLDKFKYLMSFAAIKEKCMEDMNVLWTMIWMFQKEKKNDVMMAGCIMSELCLTETKLGEIQSYQYPEPEN
eukprot:297404_1